MRRVLRKVRFGSAIALYRTFGDHVGDYPPGALLRTFRGRCHCLTCVAGEGVCLVMDFFSDFRLFEKPPRSPGLALFRWIAWRWLMFGSLFILFVGFFAAMHYLGGEPIYYTNEDRNLSEGEVRTTIGLFVSGAGLFSFLGLAGVLFIPKA